EEAKLLADETLDGLLQKHYAGESPSARAVQDLIQIQGGGEDRHIRFLVVRLHDYTQSLTDPAGWFDSQLKCFSSEEPVLCSQWFAAALVSWPLHWPAVLRRDFPGNDLAIRCADVLGEAAASADPSAASWAALEEVRAVLSDVPRPKKGKWSNPL